MCLTDCWMILDNLKYITEGIFACLLFYSSAGVPLFVSVFCKKWMFSATGIETCGGSGRIKADIRGWGDMLWDILWNM